MRSILGIAVGILILALFSQWIRLPLGFQGVWMSPDETANAVSGVAFAEHGTFAVPFELVKSFPWAVPRSFVAMVSQGQIVPVGFLGMPLVLAGAYKLAGTFGVILFTPLIALLTLWALWQILPKAWPKIARVSALLVWMSFPTVIIYANRGAFANLFITCLAIWIWWLLDKAKGFWTWPVAGALLGLACVIRPPEAVWLLPLAVFAILYNRQQRQTPVQPKQTKQYIFMGTVFALILLCGAYLGHKTYGHWLTSGYQIRPTATVVSDQAEQQAMSKAVSIFSIQPLAIHPKSMLWNAWSYLGTILWPWTLMGILVLGLCIQKRVWITPEKWIMAGALWTFVWLVGFYGNGLYQDHVGTNIPSMGNSYLRYLLPLSVMAAVSVGYLVNELWKYWSLRTIAIVLTAFLVFVGLWDASARDDEGMLANQKEFIRYAAIRQQARSMLAPGTVVLSDRSDKIFFPVFPAVSPMPKPEDIVALGDKAKVAIFVRTISGQDALGQSKGINLVPLFTSNNESLYDVD
ncbi:MAG: hypothetical protein ACYC44_03720 [Patescibacteria group bacterium]